MKPPHGTIALRSLDESRETSGEGRIRDYIGDVAKNALEFLTWRAGNKLRVSVRFKVGYVVAMTPLSTPQDRTEKRL
jgi:hypothetical protein